MSADGSTLAQSLPGKGELARLVRERDWSGSPLGPASCWPQSLRTAVNILLTSRYSMWMGWGEKLTFLYNDAYRPTLGIKHPWALGSPAREVWSEIWPDIGPRLQAVLSTGEATYDEGLLLVLERSGFPEETYHTFSYSPLFDDAGQVSGMFCVVTEETDRIIGERRMGTLRELASALAGSNTEAEVLSAVRGQLGRNAKDLPFALVYLYDSQSPARLVTAAGFSDEQRAALGRADLPWPAEDLLRHPHPRVQNVSQWQVEGQFPAGAWDKPPTRAAIVPIPQQGHEEPAGFLVVGINPYRRYDAGYAGFIDLVAGQIGAGIGNARAYEEERRRAEALAELDQAKTQFFSNVSHEFRTPLTLMLGPLEDILAASGERVSPEKRELLSVVHRNGLRLLRLVNSLLDFSRIEAGRVKARFELLDLSVFTAELASTFRSATERAGLQLVVDCPPLPQHVFVDRDMWEKIVLNLLSNAFTFTFEGSITVRLRESGKAAELSVSDTGTGIPEHEVPHLFERFHRVEGARGRTFEGSGIGLALVQELVKLHGGSIRIDSELGRGSTFVVAVPFGKDHIPPEQIQSSEWSVSTAVQAEAFVEEALRWLPGVDADASGQLLGHQDFIPPVSEQGDKHGTVLIADDNADMRHYIERLLRNQYEVLTAKDGEEALQIASSQAPDLVLSDVMMPKLDGFGLLRALRKHQQTQTTPVILLSARAGEEARTEGMDAGADDYLVKPFSARELLSRVGAHLRLAQIRKRHAEALQQSNADLVRANRELEEFAYVSSHDLQEPLRMVNIYTHLLLRRFVGENPEAQKYAGFISQGVQRMEELLRDLLSYSRVIHADGLPDGTADLSEALSQARELLKTRIDEIDPLILAGPLPGVRGDTSQIAHVFQNLLSNSLKYRDPERRPEIRISATEDGDCWTICVHDNGIGFHQEYADRIFGLFKRLHKDEYPGTGLGLAICQRIVERYGGRMWAEGRPGQGSTFYFSLLRA